MTTTAIPTRMDIAYHLAVVVLIVAEIGSARAVDIVSVVLATTCHGVVLNAALRAVIHL